MDFKKYLNERVKAVNQTLKEYLEIPSCISKTLREAMQYSILGGGKRFRSILLIAAAESVGGNYLSVIPAACALELIHNFSLIHDDLPSMDNDDFRRGKPALHKVYGESLALLAGDALLTYAFKLASDNFKIKGIKIKNVLRAIQELADATGFSGMIGGQALDISLNHRAQTMEDTDLQYIHNHKTGALIQAAVRIGAILSDANSLKLRKLTNYAQNIGLVYQIIDDLLDAETSNNITYPKLYGVSDSFKKAKDITNNAIMELKSFNTSARPLRELAVFLLNRKF
ncbi:MAG: polyprenyl synthetase family protein [Armatimonadetes bacterium]|nr:polyprenyl synthetase family protein [Armatimonadota bacterium]